MLECFRNKLYFVYYVTYTIILLVQYRLVVVPASSTSPPRPQCVDLVLPTSHPCRCIIVPVVPPSSLRRCHRMTGIAWRWRVVRQTSRWARRWHGRAWGWRVARRWSCPPRDVVLSRPPHRVGVVVASLSRRPRRVAAVELW